LRPASAIDLSVSSEHGDGTGIRLERLAEMADALLDQVSTVREHYEHLQQTLEETLPEPEPTVGGASPVLDSYEDHHDGDSDWDPDSGEPQVHDSARLVVMEMAMSGSTRDETKSYLRESLGVAGGDPVVDEVFDRTEAAQEAPPLHRRLFTRRRD
jgi:hypothetical protein